MTHVVLYFKLEKHHSWFAFSFHTIIDIVHFLFLGF